MIGGLFGAGLVIVAMSGTGWSDPGFVPSASTPPAPAQASGLITHMSAADGQPMTLTVIDPREHWIGVYHIDRATGAIELKGTRNITWDLKVEFNSGKPTPQEIRSSLQR
jgi:hypothetical protein